MANTLTDEQFDEAQDVYRSMAELQRKLWEKSRELEEIIGCAVDTSFDLEAHTLEYFIDLDEPI